MTSSFAETYQITWKMNREKVLQHLASDAELKQIAENFMEW
jgi:hypothetical protein